MHFLADVYVTCEVCKGQALQRGHPAREVEGQAPSPRCSRRRVSRRHRAVRAPPHALRHPADARSRWASATSPSASRPRRSRAARRSGSSSRASWPSATPAARSTCSTSPRPGLHFEDVRRLLAVLGAPGGSRQHGARHRAQPRRHQVRRLDHRPRPRGRRPRRRGHRRRHARGGGGGGAQLHRAVPGGAAADPQGQARRREITPSHRAKRGGPEAGGGRRESPRMLRGSEFWKSPSSFLAGRDGRSRGTNARDVAADSGRPPPGLPPRFARWEGAKVPAFPRAWRGRG